MIGQGTESYGHNLDFRIQLLECRALNQPPERSGASGTERRRLS
jgi:hypothetical protein